MSFPSTFKNKLNDPAMGLLYRLSLGHLMTDGFAGFMLPLLPILSIELGFGLEATGVILMVSSVTSSVLQPLWGVLTERYQRVNYLLIGLLMSIVCISLIGWSPDYLTLLLLIGLGYLGVGILHPRAMTYAHSLGFDKTGKAKTGRDKQENPKKRENLVMSVFITAGTSGFALGPLVSAFLVTHWGLKATILTMPLLLLGWWLFHNIDRPFLKILAKPPLAKGNPKFTGWELRVLALLSFVAIVRAIILVGMDSFMPFVWTEQGFSLMYVGVVMALASIISAPISLYAGHLSDRFGERVILFASFVPCLLFVPLTLSFSGLWSFVFFILLHAFIQLSMTANMVVPLRGIGHHKNLISGLMAGFSFGVAGVMMPLLGRMGEEYGLTQALSYLLIPMAFGTIALLFIPKAIYLKNK